MNLPAEPRDKPSLSPSIIDRAPTSVAGNGSDQGERIAQLQGLNAKLSEELSAAKSELAKLKGVSQAETIKAQLIKPYATGIFRFMCVYTAFVGAVIMLHGFKLQSFSIAENVLMILAGSTALAVIGLVKIVVSGLFNIPK